jgi:nucleotide sugar dehydrogenase
MRRNDCVHAAAVHVETWVGMAGTTGTVAVVGAGKMGLPLAAQFASHGWNVVAVDVQQSVVTAINEGRSHIRDEPGLADLVAEAREQGRLRATTDATEAVGTAEVVVVIVPVVLNDRLEPDRHNMDAAVESIAPRLHPGSTVIFETTLPVGDTRNRYGPILERASGLRIDKDLFVAFSPERLYSGATLSNLATYPKLVGGLGPASTARAAAFYDSVLDAEIVAMTSAEAAEFAKLAETTYRDVNIALANEFARFADGVGIDVQEIIQAANSQPYSHVHQPGLGVGGHCIPVYPHFLLSTAPELELVATARRVNDAQVGLALERVDKLLGGLDGVPVLVLGLTYRAGVKELAYSRALPLIEQLSLRGAIVSAYDPLLTEAETAACCGRPWRWGDRGPFRAIICQTADARFRELDFALFPALELVFDGRNSISDVPVPASVMYVGMGVRSRSGLVQGSNVG